MNLRGDLNYDRYRIDQQEEWVAHIGAATAPAVLLLPPLFEELNRVRALLANVMRDLAAKGFGCWLPDLPGTGESARSLEACSWGDWRAAAAAAAEHVANASGHRPLVLSVRGGALLDDGCAGAGTWRFAPAEGASLARDLIRSNLSGSVDRLAPVIDLAGYRVPKQLLDDLEAAAPTAMSPLRVVRLASDRADADAKIDGPALWRRSEPGTSPELAAAMTADILTWAEQCGVC